MLSHTLHRVACAAPLAARMGALQGARRAFSGLPDPPSGSSTGAPSQTAGGSILARIQHHILPESIFDTDAFEAALLSELERLAGRRGWTAEGCLEDEDIVTQALMAVTERSAAGEHVGLQRGAGALPSTRDMPGSRMVLEEEHPGRTGMSAAAHGVTDNAASKPQA